MGDLHSDKVRTINEHALPGWHDGPALVDVVNQVGREGRELVVAPSPLWPGDPTTGARGALYPRLIVTRPVQTPAETLPRGEGGRSRPDGR